MYLSSMVTALYSKMWFEVSWSSDSNRAIQVCFWLSKLKITLSGTSLTAVTVTSGPIIHGLSHYPPLMTLPSHIIMMTSSAFSYNHDDWVMTIKGSLGPRIGGGGMWRAPGARSHFKTIFGSQTRHEKRKNLELTLWIMWLKTLVVLNFRLP